MWQRRISGPQIPFSEAWGKPLPLNGLRSNECFLLFFIEYPSKYAEFWSAINLGCGPLRISIVQDLKNYFEISSVFHSDQYSLQKI